MKAKLLSVFAVTALALTALAVIGIDDSDATATAPVTVHPIPDRNPWVSKEPLIYLNGFSSMNFEDDPYDALSQYLSGIITLDQLKTMCGYTDTPVPGVDYYTVNHSGNASLRCEKTAYRINIIEELDDYFTEDPYDNVVSYIQREISRDELRTRSGHTTTPSADDYHVTYSHDSDNVVIQSNWAYQNLSIRSYYNGQWYFTEDPHEAMQMYLNKEITEDQLKTMCGYVESDKVNWNGTYYNANFDWNGRLNIHYSRTIIGESINNMVDAYFTEDPYDAVVRYINEEINLATLKTMCGYVDNVHRESGKSYYYVSISGEPPYTNDDKGRSVRYEKVSYIQVTPKYLYLEPGDYHISVTDSDCTNVYVQCLAGRLDCYIDIKDRAGSDDFTLEGQNAIWVTGYASSGTGTIDDTWREKSITYTIDPAPAEGKTVTDFPKTVKVLSDHEWVRYTTTDSYTGYFTNENSGQLMFIKDSAEEKEFLANVIDKGLMDGSEYWSDHCEPAGEKLVIYVCRNTSSSLDRTAWLNQRTEEGTTWRYITVQAEVTGEKLSAFDVKPYKFYANYDFSIAVKYDMNKIKAVVMIYPNAMGQTVYSVLQSDRLYDFHRTFASEYELYAIPMTTGEATLEPSEIGLYTENVATSDDYGMIFAVIAIVLCILAFGTLFYAGRRPMWSDSTGLPDGSESESESEAPADGISVSEDIEPEPEIPEENTKDE